jgi:hypothetical protein
VACDPGENIAERPEELVEGRARWRRPFHAQLTDRGYRPTAMVRVAELGQDASLISAADLARR